MKSPSALVDRGASDRRPTACRRPRSAAASAHAAHKDRIEGSRSKSSISVASSHVGRAVRGGWRGLSDRLPDVGMIERLGHLQVALAACYRALPVVIVGDRLQPVQEARRHGRRARDFAACDRITSRAPKATARSRGRQEPMRRSGRSRRRRTAHRPAQPRIIARLRRPHAFDKATKDNAIGVGKARYPSGP